MARKEQQAEYRRRTKEKRRLKQAEYRAANKKAIAVKNKAYNELHKKEKQEYNQGRKELVKKRKESRKEEISAYNKNYREENKEILNIKKREKHLLNKDIENARSREYKQTHKKEVKNYSRQYNTNRLKTDTLYKLSCNLRTRLSTALRGNTKKGSAVRDLGCTIPEFKIYLESLFTEGMTWENYGSFWHLDHLKPISLFNLLDETEFKEAVHFSNIQPLSAEANIQKHNTFSESDQEKYNLLHSKYFPELDKSSPNT